MVLLHPILAESCTRYFLLLPSYTHPNHLFHFPSISFFFFFFFFFFSFRRNCLFRIVKDEVKYSGVYYYIHTKQDKETFLDLTFYFNCFCIPYNKKDLLFNVGVIRPLLDLQ
uniref:Putative uncharacterized protein YGR069W n=1 Tax=Saccharomyces cerevisiae (strain ATCC 204508 / S288c) TaxID=559292 RepID=YG2C_YEAST|nr:RecName: Full=Putative uncharacterized protein YGR069W [Saccharomyces cerevisiae S288C]CAA97071.1 unnamed protein product [Saccharomyces cerevisiae]